ncbi:MAG: hypothetical protein IPK82_24105 [Polyangiaceae bacterium]|nr:hypothetical protein [Polyangiaceae bacterium]
MSARNSRVAVFWQRLAEIAKQETRLANERETVLRELANEYSSTSSEGASRRGAAMRQHYQPQHEPPVSDIVRARARRALKQFGFSIEDIKE